MCRSSQTAGPGVRGRAASYLLEGELDGLVLAQLQHVHQLHDGLVAAVQLVLPLDELLLLLREVDKLVQGLLVDVAVLLQLRVALLQLPEQLLPNTHICILTLGHHTSKSLQRPGFSLYSYLKWA